MKTNAINGMPLPGIAPGKTGRDVEIVRSFGYSDFKGRLPRQVLIGRKAPRPLRIRGFLIFRPAPKDY
jgi:hypothetical protein